MPQTIIEYLHYHVVAKPNDVAFKHLPTDDNSLSGLTYKEFWFEALSVARFLKNKTQVGDKVLLVYPSSLDYVVAFYGCLLARVVAVPVSLSHENSALFVKAVNGCKPVLALTTLNEISTVKAFWQEQEHLVKPLNIFTTNNSVSLLGDLGAVIEIAPRSPAFLHFIEDSAGRSKEVVVTHTDIMESVKYLASKSAEQPDDIFVEWLPLFQSMELTV